MSAPPSSSAGHGPAGITPAVSGKKVILGPVGNVVGEKRDGASASSAEGSGDENSGGSASSAEGSGDESAGGSASSAEGSGDESDGGSASSAEGSGDESDGGSTSSSEGSGDETDGYSLEEGDGNFTVRFHRRSAESEQSSGEEEAEDFLCLLICDLLAVLPRTSNQCWDDGICRRVSAGLNSCDGHDKNSQKNLNDRGSDIEDVSETNDAEHSVTIDVRGRYIDDAKEELMTHLVRCSRVSDLRYLKVIVGCKVHGVGKGKLMQSLIDLLELDDTIEWKKENEGSVISIKLEAEKDYSSLGWDVNSIIQPFEQGQGLEKEKALSQVVTDAEEKDFLCTFVCDFVFGIPKVANTCWDINMCKRIAAGSIKCNRAEFERQKPYYNMDNAVTFDIRGQFVVDALNIFKSQLYSYSGMSSPISSIKYLDVIVGCKVHGIGEGKLKQAVVDVLEKEDDLKWKEEYGGAVLHIKLDGREYFNFLGEDFVPPVFGMDISDNSVDSDDSHNDASHDDSKDYSGSD